VSKDWQFVLNETSVHFLLSLQSHDRQKLLKVLEILADEPMQKGNFETKDATGRVIQIKAAGRFLISYWPDALIKELRVINIERV
jgi:hypothetical protein